MYDGTEGPLFSSMVSREVLSEVVKSSRIFRQFSEVLNSSRNSQTVLGSLKQFSVVSMSFRESKEFSGFLKSCQCYQRAQFVCGCVCVCVYFLPP